MPPRPSRATIRYRSMRTVPGENPPLCGGCDLTGAGGAAAGLPGSNVGVSGMEMARPQVGHKRAFSEHNAPQPEQVIMRTDCIAPRGEAGKPNVWNATMPIKSLAGTTVHRTTGRSCSCEDRIFAAETRGAHADAGQGIQSISLS